MTFGVDARHLAAGRAQRGVGHYTAALLSAMTALHGDDRWRALVPGTAPHQVPDGVEVVRTRTPARLLFGAAALTRRPRLDRLLGDDLDVVWAPAPAPLALSADARLVLTVHDVSWIERPGDFTAYERLWHRLMRFGALLRRAAAIIVPSAVTGGALSARFGVDPGCVHVIPSGITRPDPAAEPPGGLPDRYVLAVGALEPRKDPELLARAHARARAAGLDAELVFAGAGRLARRLDGRPGVHVLGAVDRRTLDALYAGATAVATPSRLEGFGFAPLEALAAGTPAVVSDLPVFAETLGDAALRIPPGDEEALAGALLRLASDPPLRQSLVAAGRSRLERLTWERAARDTRAVLAGAAR